MKFTKIAIFSCNVGSNDDRFSIEIYHGGFFCGMGLNITYLDYKVDTFDEFPRGSFS